MNSRMNPNSNRSLLLLLPLAIAALAAGWLLSDSRGNSAKPGDEHSRLHEEPQPRYACPISVGLTEASYPSDPQARVAAKAVIVNHHLLAANLIAEMFSRIPEPSTIVVVSPNHFGRGDGHAITTDRDWETCQGVIEADRETIARLAGLVVEEAPFDSEHGIGNLLPFIEKSFPRAKLVPLMIKETASEEELSSLAEALARELPKGSLVVGSFDFSHETTSAVADRQDRESILWLESMDPINAMKAAVDSKKGMYLVMDYSKKAGAESFVTVRNSNSARILGKPESREVTSYITGYFP